MRSKLGIILLIVLTIIFFANLIGIGILLFIYSDRIDTVTKVVSIIWGAISALLPTLGWGKKPDKLLTFDEVLMLRPMIILNVMVSLGLLVIYYQIAVREIPARFIFKDEFGNSIEGKLRVNHYGSQEIKNGICHVDFITGENSIHFEATKYFLPLQDSFSIPIFWKGDSIVKEYTCRFKKGKLRFTIKPSNASLKIYTTDTLRIKNMEPIASQYFGSEFTSDSLPVGRYKYIVSHDWYRSKMGTVSVQYNDSNRDSVNLKPIDDAGVFIDVDNAEEPDKIEIYKDHKWQRDVNLISNPFIPFTDLDQHLIELKDFDKSFYYSAYHTLSEPKRDTLKCHLTPQPISYVEFYSEDYSGYEIYVDGRFRDHLDKEEGSVVIPIFDGYREIKIGDWERIIKFPVVDNYIEINRSEQ